MKFVYASDEPRRTIGCDGLPPCALALSHWPGNSTPPALKRDLSTGIALAFAECRARFGEFDVVTNDHFDTDGLLSVFVCLHPEEALRREDALLAAARAGDFRSAPSGSALMFDLAVSCFTDPQRSPLGADLRPLSEKQREALAYEALLDRLPEAIDHPQRLGADVEEELAAVAADLGLLRSGGAGVERRREADLVRLDLPRAVDPRAANELAQCDRVLELREGDGGTYAELRFSSESWFDLPSRRRLPRPDLAALAARLAQSERARGEWIAGSASDPFPSVAFGARIADASVRGKPFDPRPSSQSPAALAATILEFLT